MIIKRKQKEFGNKENKAKKNNYIKSLAEDGDIKSGRNVLKSMNKEDYLVLRSRDIEKGAKYHRLANLSPKWAKEYYNRYFERHPNVIRLTKKAHI